MLPDGVLLIPLPETGEERIYATGRGLTVPGTQRYHGMESYLLQVAACLTRSGERTQAYRTPWQSIFMSMPWLTVSKAVQAPSW